MPLQYNDLGGQLGGQLSPPAPPPPVASYTVTTLAGTGVAGAANGLDAAATFNQPNAISFDTAGNYYVADYGNHLIRKITRGGTVSTFAGISGTTGKIDASGTQATFKFPAGIAVTSTGTVYIADSGNNVIRSITAGGTVTTRAGGGAAGGVAAGYTDATGTSAKFNKPNSVTLDKNGNLYVADQNNNAIRKVTPAGVVTTVVGSSTGVSGSMNGAFASALFNGPQDIAVTMDGNLFVADSGNNRIRFVNMSAQTVSTAVGSTAGYTDGPATSALVSGPQGLSLDAAGNLYISDYGNNVIRMLMPNGVVMTVAGNGTAGYKDGVGNSVQFKLPQEVRVSPLDGLLYVPDSGNNAIRVVSPPRSSPSSKTPAYKSAGAIAGYVIAGVVVVGGGVALAVYCTRKRSSSGSRRMR